MLNKKIILTGKLIQLEPLQEEHRKALRLLSRNEKTSVYSPALKLKFDSWFDKALKDAPESEQLTFIVRDLKNKNILGSTRFYEIYFNHRRLSIGYTWYIPEVWSTGVNVDYKLLQLNYAFQELQMNRVEFDIDARNERSRAAVKKLGATEEGILRQHIILDDGHLRDTVIYSILKNEWSALAIKLKNRLNNFLH